MMQPRIKPLLALLVLTSLYHPGQPDGCDPDIPSRSLPKNYMAAFKTDKRPETCSRGQYLNGSECKPCGHGTFMTSQMAQENTHAHCLPCNEPGMYEITTEPCTTTRDAKIMCEDGYYRVKVPGKPCQSECRRCDVCGLGINMFKNYEGRECSGDQNTICCHEEHMVVVDGDCKNRPTTPPPTSTTPTSTSTTISEYQSVFSDEIKVGFLRSSGETLHHSGYIPLVLTVCVVVVLAKHGSIFS
ncbi:unnamed protein product [Lymnaea stagnalis]|uniref:TNFR-Cys domain-containing protein n=1 Tax=Lymnaea stagnalis TaxID=6523 RepID=A0AAV2HH06_LYMST